MTRILAALSLGLTVALGAQTLPSSARAQSSADWPVTADDIAFADEEAMLYAKIIVRAYNRVLQEEPMCERFDLMVGMRSYRYGTDDDPVFFIPCVYQDLPVSVYFSRSDIERGRPLTVEPPAQVR